MKPRVYQLGAVFDAYNCAGDDVIAVEMEPVPQDVGPVADQNGFTGFSVTLSNCLAEVADDWRALEAQGIDSPGQSFDFVASWIEHNTIAQKDCLFLVARVGESPVALLPLVRTRKAGRQIATFFAGDHVGCNAPLIDRIAFAAMTSDQRVSVWTRMLKLAIGVDVVLMPNVIAAHGARCGLDGPMTRTSAPDLLYRAEFANWAQCDAERRDRKKRKVDRQQRAKLETFGALECSAVGPGKEAQTLIETMFAQRAYRFAVQGIPDPFAAPKVRAFYKDLFETTGGVLHVLRLDGDPVAIRYNLALGDRLYCLISSMSQCQAIQSGSPGKQGLLHVMQTVFDAGCASFDMGKGLTDEKKLWCNKVIDLDCYHLARTPLGRILLFGHQAREHARGLVKNNPVLFSMFRQLRSQRGRPQMQSSEEL